MLSSTANVLLCVVCRCCGRLCACLAAVSVLRRLVTISGFRRLVVAASVPVSVHKAHFQELLRPFATAVSANVLDELTLDEVLEKMRKTIVVDDIACDDSDGDDDDPISVATFLAALDEEQASTFFLSFCLSFFICLFSYFPRAQDPLFVRRHVPTSSPGQTL